MTRKTLRSLKDLLNKAQAEIDQLKRERIVLECEAGFGRQMTRRFDQLLEGVCMGMKEANLPRRGH